MKEKRNRVVKKRKIRQNQRVNYGTGKCQGFPGGKETRSRRRVERGRARKTRRIKGGLTSETGLLGQIAMCSTTKKKVINESLVVVIVNCKQREKKAPHLTFGEKSFSKVGGGGGAPNMGSGTLPKGGGCNEIGVKNLGGTQKNRIM